ncbi:MAG: acyl-CoA thioesterase [Deltaproteobacteria bacterium]|nr:acyl-CoA thioesterase [Deltaproteobacteria bacterium]
MKAISENKPIVVYEEIFPSDTNPYGTAFGGKILSLMDRAAGLAASRYAHCHFVTASLDSIRFVGPVRQGDIAQVTAKVIYTSSRTCGVKVTVESSNKLDWKTKQCCQGLLFMVAIGPDGRPVTVPAFEPCTEEEKREFQHASAVHRKMLGKRY